MNVKDLGRSIPGFDLHSALCNTSQYLEKYGGHEMAVGLSLNKNQFENFRNAFEDYAENTNIKDILPIIKIDKEVDFKSINIDVVKELNLLEPYGESNKMPLFIFRKLKIDSIRALSEGKHLKLTLKSDNIVIAAIGFNMGNFSNEFRIGDKIDVIGTLEINQFNNINSVQINMKDLRSSY